MLINQPIQVHRDKEGKKYLTEKLYPVFLFGGVNMVRDPGVSVQNVCVPGGLHCIVYDSHFCSGGL